MQVVSLQSGSKKAQLRNKKKVAAVKKALLRLPKFRLLACRGSEWEGGMAVHEAVESIVNLHRVKWRCLCIEGNSRLYERT